MIFFFFLHTFSKTRTHLCKDFHGLSAPFRRFRFTAKTIYSGELKINRILLKIVTGFSKFFCAQAWTLLQSNVERRQRPMRIRWSGSCRWMWMFWMLVHPWLSKFHLAVDTCLLDVNHAGTFGIWSSDISAVWRFWTDHWQLFARSSCKVAQVELTARKNPWKKAEHFQVFNFRRCGSETPQGRGRGG